MNDGEETMRDAGGETGVSAGSVSAGAVAITTTVARSGARVASLDGRRLHSNHEPLIEAERAARGIVPEGPDTLVAFFGAGLGYVVARYLAEHPNRCVWFEPFPELAQLALETAGVDQYVQSGRLRIVTGHPGEDLLEDVFRGSTNADVYFYVHQASFAAHPAYRVLERVCRQFLNRKSVNLATLARFDREWTRNLAQNLPHLMRGRPVRELFGSRAGGTAIVCGAGPSLASSFAEIRSARSGALLVAVDTAVRPLVQAGLDPDVIVSVDPQAVNRHYLEDYHGNAIFVLDPTASYHCVRSLPEDRLYYTASPFPLARIFFEQAHGPPGDISFGGSVSTNAYDLVIRMGCSEVFLYGQDFGFSGGLAHVRGAVLEDRWNFMESRLRRRELHNYRQLSALPVRWLPRSDGGRVQTNDKLLIFHGWFARRLLADIEQGARVVNRTPLGAVLPAVPTEPSPSARPAVQESVRSTLAPRAPVSGMTQAEIAERVARRLELLLADVIAFEDVARAGLAVAEDLASALPDPARRGGASSRYQQLLARMNECDAEMHNLARASEVVSSLMQGAIFRITESQGGGLNQTAAAAEPGVGAARTVELYQAMTEAARLLSGLLRRALAVIGGIAG